MPCSQRSTRSTDPGPRQSETNLTGRPAPGPVGSTQRPLSSMRRFVAASKLRRLGCRRTHLRPARFGGGSSVAARVYVGDAILAGDVRERAKRRAILRCPADRLCANRSETGVVRLSDPDGAFSMAGAAEVAHASRRLQTSPRCDASNSQRRRPFYAGHRLQAATRDLKSLRVIRTRVGHFPTLFPKAVTPQFTTVTTEEASRTTRVTDAELARAGSPELRRRRCGGDRIRLGRLRDRRVAGSRCA